MTRLSIEIPVLSSAGEAEASARLTRVLAEAGADVRRVEDGDALVRAIEASPAAFVILDASAEGVALCSRVRASEHGARATIAMLSNGDSRDAFAAGADIVWPAGVSDAIVLGAVSRASARARSPEDAASVIDSAPDALFILSECGKIRRANAGVQAMLGHVPVALEGRRLSELVHEDDAHLVHGLLDEVVTASDLVPPSVVRVRRHDESFVEVELAARNLTSLPGVQGIVVDAREASERMSVGAALQESEMRFGAIFENLLDGLVQVDEETRCLVRVNPAFCRITGYSPEEVSSLTLLDLFPEDGRQAAAKALDAHFRGERAVSDAMCILHRNGTPLYVDIGTTRMELSGIRFMLAVVRDVTARRETERTRELFLAVVAHELRTPVAVLQNSVELLRSKPPPSPSDHDVIVDVLADEVQRLVRLVADALDVAAIQAGTLTLKPHRVELSRLVTSVVARVAPQFDGRANIEVESVDAFVDPLRFEQVVTNLVDNAWRHGGDPEIDVVLTVAQGAARLEVIDRGPGLPEAMKARMFERALVPNERPTAGIGIGLWLSKRLVGTMGGTIEVANGPEGRGMRIAVSFPALAASLEVGDA